MKERLTQRNSDGSVGISECRYYNYNDFQKIAGKLAYYEDLEEQGKLILLPCKVGDVVYSIQGLNGKPEQCEPYTVTDITIYEYTITIHITDEWLFCRNIYPDDIGKTVFLTKEEAEQKVKEREKI